VYYLLEREAARSLRIILNYFSCVYVFWQGLSQHTLGEISSFRDNHSPFFSCFFGRVVPSFGRVVPSHPGRFIFLWNNLPFSLEVSNE